MQLAKVAIVLISRVVFDYCVSNHWGEKSSVSLARVVKYSKSFLENPLMLGRDKGEKFPALVALQIFPEN